MKEINLVQEQVNELTKQIDQSEDLNLYLQRAEIYRNTNQYHLAFHDYMFVLCMCTDEVVVKQSLSNLQAMLQFIGHESFLNYEEQFKKLLKKFPDNPNLNFLTAKYYELIENYRRATIYFKKAISLDDSNPIFFKEFVEYYLEQEKIKKGLEILNEAIEKFPHFAPLYVTLARIDFVKNRKRLAFSHIEKALQLDPTCVEAYYHRSNFYNYTENFEDAINDLTECILLEPENPSYYFERSLTYSDQNEIELAYKDLNKVVEINPNYDPAYFIRAEYHYKKGYPSEALKDLNKAIELNSDDPNYFILRGLLHEEMGKKKAALSDFEKARENGATDEFSMF